MITEQLAYAQALSCDLDHAHHPYSASIVRRLIDERAALLAACEVALCAYQLAGKDTPDNSTASALRDAIAVAQTAVPRPSCTKGG